VTVATARVEAVALPRHQPVAGTVRPVERAVIAARIMGTVSVRPPALGTRVAASEILLTLSAGELSARLEQARATLAQLERERAREASLLEQGASTAESVRLLEDRRRAAVAAVEEAAALWAYTAVTAPFAGVVTRRHVEAGDLATPGAPLLELEGVDHLRVEVPVPETLPALAPGTELAVEIEGTALAGRLAEFSPAADPGTRTRLAQVDLPAGAAARSGQFVRVRWPAESAPALLVPADVVSRFGQMERVYVVRDGRAELRLVRTGATVGDRVQILAGLDAGEIVVNAPPAALRDGQPLEIRP